MTSCGRTICSGGQCVICKRTRTACLWSWKHHCAYGARSPLSVAAFVSARGSIRTASWKHYWTGLAAECLAIGGNHFRSHSACQSLHHATHLHLLHIFASALTHAQVGKTRFLKVPNTSAMSLAWLTQHLWRPCWQRCRWFTSMSALNLTPT